MLYLFTGNNDFLIKEKVSEWKKLFVQKNGDFDLIHFKDISNISNDQISSSLTGNSFFSNKKLIIIDDLPSSLVSKNKILSQKQDYLLTLLDKVPENNIVIFSSSSPDKRSKFYKQLNKLAELKIFDASSDQDLYSIVSNKYPGKISNSAINLIIRYKSGNLTKIISEIDKLLITNDKIEEKAVLDNIIPELEESVFQVIDDIMNNNINNAIIKIDIILNDTIVYAFYNNLISNLRTNIYISNLKNIGVSPSKIGDLLNLGNRSFLVNKSYKITVESLNNLYINLVNIDKKMKSGFLTGTQDIDFRNELEKTLLNTSG